VGGNLVNRINLQVLRFSADAAILRQALIGTSSNSLGDFTLVYLTDKLGGAKNQPPVLSMSCARRASLCTSKVPFMAFFRVSTLRWATQMRAILSLIFLVTVSPVSAFAQDNLRTSDPMFKGVELYSWKDSTSGTWSYALLPGTNRNKTLAEIKTPKVTISEVAQLKRRLSNLAEGEHVYWYSGRLQPELSYPDKEVVADIVAFAAEHKVTVDIIK
jgi:hypothetical protein